MHPFYVGGFGTGGYRGEIDAIDAAGWKEVAEETGLDAGAATDVDDLGGSVDWGVDYIAVHQLDEPGCLVFETGLFVWARGVSLLVWARL